MAAVFDLHLLLHPAQMCAQVSERSTEGPTTPNRQWGACHTPTTRHSQESIKQANRRNNPPLWHTRHTLTARCCPGMGCRADGAAASGVCRRDMVPLHMHWCCCIAAP